MGYNAAGSGTETSLTDIKLAGLASGFTLGFGFLTVWKAIRQTMMVRSLVVLLSIFVNWICEVQCLMQIIINRVYIVAEDRDFVDKVKWATAIIISTIIVVVGCIWLPAHRFVEANRIWDPISKALICAVDASLNIWFLVIVRRIVNFYGLTKYKVLIRFNARLVVVSVTLDME
ncbi:hypothetical protein NEMBOFW57_010793 [Staphylotrichum longicolle]|uniref:Uncharacterized protein n=1 Tax=Staphylotrichum longicolle TaxID=669026 RepID=A0AAD4ENP8_9PEZI|nr:hypothetical protein NEMBOFW57_010793 [Staphylotrichum longicolle]